MCELTLLLLRAITLACRGHHDVVLENLALRHQLRTLQRRVKRPHLRTRDRMFWVLLATCRSPECCSSLTPVLLSAATPDRIRTCLN